MTVHRFLGIAEELESAGLLWRPEIGDEISDRTKPDQVSILVDPQGLTPVELRETYLWLPSVEQMVVQLEVRQAVLYHVGLELSEQEMFYKTIVQSKIGTIEAQAPSLRSAVGIALRDVLLTGPQKLH